nr:hypothetical protein [Tanacetum cinerariifolium]
MPPKPNLVFVDEHVVSESVTSLPGIAKSKVKISETKLKNVSVSIIKDWVSDSKDKNKIETQSKKIKPSFTKKTRRNLGVKGTETLGFDKTKVESYNFHRRGHFARECRAFKHQDNRNREAPRRTMPAEDGSTNFALMVYTSSSSSSTSNSDTK